jgi:hypothetical protein
MGIQPAPPLANIWMSSFEDSIKEDASIFDRYVDDTLLDIEDSEIDNRLAKINDLHPKLEFTLERPVDNTIPFLDMKIRQLEDGKIETMWYRKPTDTGMTLNFHAVAPFKYKRNVIQGLTHRIYNASSTWSNFHIGLEDGIRILNENQYPEELSRRIMKTTLDKLYTGDCGAKPIRNETEERVKKWMFLPYRGQATDAYIKKLTNIGALIRPIITTTKVKDVLPTLKPKIPKEFQSNLVYQFKCSRCTSTYVGKTWRHLLVRVQEHRNKKKQVIRKHADDCNSEVTMDNFKILTKTNRNNDFLETLEALFIRELKPNLNTKEDFRNKDLRLKF